MLLMFLIYKLTRNKGNISAFAKEILTKRFILKIKYFISLLILLLLLISSTGANKNNDKVEKISFRIYKKNSCIGFVNIKRTSMDHTTTYIVDSEVNAKVIFNFKATGREKSVYKEDTLIFSSMYRKINNRIKLNQSIELINGKYLLSENQTKEALDLDIIHRNLVTLFFNEPIGVRKIYSDKFKEIIKITPKSNGRYMIVLPNKSSSIYHYKNGVCTMIEITGTFFKVKLKHV